MVEAGTEVAEMGVASVVAEMRVPRGSGIQVVNAFEGEWETEGSNMSGGVPVVSWEVVSVSGQDVEAAVVVIRAKISDGEGRAEDCGAFTGDTRFVGSFTVFALFPPKNLSSDICFLECSSQNFVAILGGSFSQVLPTMSWSLVLLPSSAVISSNKSIYTGQ